MGQGRRDLATAAPDTAAMAEPLLEQLALVERRISESETHIQRQREIIAGLDLERAGLDPAAACDLLRAYEQSLSAQLAELERLRQELATDAADSAP